MELVIDFARLQCVILNQRKHLYFDRKVKLLGGGNFGAIDMEGFVEGMDHSFYIS